MLNFLNRLLAIKNWKIFVFALAAGFLLVLGTSIYQHWQSQLPHPIAALPSSAQKPPEIKLLAHDIGVSEQLQPNAMPWLAASHYAAVIDLRPDGEEPDQPGSAVMKQAAEASRLTFHYVPVPHGVVPENAVAGLQAALANSPRPVLLYCRSGRRAARAFSLVEASRVDGPSLDEIITAASAAGQEVSDMKEALEARIAARKG